MLMDDPPFSCRNYNPTWRLHPYAIRMSWDRNLDDLHLSSLTNTPQRDVGQESDTNNDPQSISPYAVGQPTHGSFGPTHESFGPTHGSFGMETSSLHEASYGYGFSEFAPSLANYSHLSPVPPAVPYRRLYEECEPLISPPPKVKRTSFDTSPSHSASFSSEESSKRARLVPGRPSQYLMGTDTTHTFDQSENLPHPSFHFASYPDHSTLARSEDDNRPANAPYAPARVYLFDDSALSAPNTGDEVSPIAKLPIQAARMVATAPPKAKSMVATAPPKAKRSKRRTGKKCASRKASSPPEANVSEKTIFTPSRDELLEAGTPRAQEALEVWYKRLGELHDYKKKYGDCNVPQKHPENPSLGTWVNKQRMEYKMYTENLKTGMTPKKLKALEDLEFDWGKRKGDTAWEQKFNELREYKRATNDCLVPTKYKPNPALGRWVSTQRSQYKLFQEGKKSTMTRERVQKLDDIGFVWCVLH